MEKIALYKVDILDDFTDEIYISLVDDPAIKEDFIFFSSEEEEKLMFFDDYKKMITGPVLIPNQKIYRKNINGSPAYVYYDENTILKSMEYFFKQGSKFNIMHQGSKVQVGILESFLTEENNKFNLPKGSWVVTAKVNDDNLFNDIKNGKLKGFSFQGLFTKQYQGEEYVFNTEKIEKSFMEDKMNKIMSAIANILFTEEVAEVVETSETTEQVQEVIEEVITEEKVETTEVVEEVIEEVVETPETPEIPEVVETKVEEVEVETEPNPVLKMQETIVDLTDKLEQLTNRFNEVNAKLDEYSKQPISQSIVEEISNAAALKQDSKITKAASFFTK